MAFQKMKRTQSPEMLAVYERLRAGGRYNGLPKAATFWKEVLDATSGHGIRPYRDPSGDWLELEEFLGAVPPLLRNYKTGDPPDLVAQMLHLEGGDEELYEKLRQDENAQTPEEFERMVEEDAEISLGLELDSISEKEEL